VFITPLAELSPEYQDRRLHATRGSATASLCQWTDSERKN
jgi:hypothetical protein